MTLKTRILVTLAFAAALGHGEVLFTTNDAPARVEGVAVWHRPADQYYYLLDDAGGAWRIRNADGRVLIRPGDRVRVEGVKPRGSARPRIERATTEKIGTGSLPEPIEMTVDEMYAVGDDGEAGRRAWYARLVAVRGIVTDINRRETYTQILLGPKSRSVQIALPIRWSDPLSKGLAFGAFVRVRGIGHYDPLPPDHKGAVTGLVNFSVYPERLADLQILDEAPFWMPLRIEEEKARAAGARGYLPKSLDWERLVAAIRLAAQDGGFIADDFDEPKVGPLSRREIEVLTYIAQGKTHEEIGMIGDISAETVRTHELGILRA